MIITNRVYYYRVYRIASRDCYRNSFVVCLLNNNSNFFQFFSRLNQCSFFLFWFLQIYFENQNNPTKSTSTSTSTSTSYFLWNYFNFIDINWLRNAHSYTYTHMLAVVQSFFLSCFSYIAASNEGH